MVKKILRSLRTLNLLQPRSITQNDRDCLMTVCISVGSFLVLLCCCATLYLPALPGFKFYYGSTALTSVTTRVEYEPYVCWISFFTSGMLLCSFATQACAIMFQKSKREIPVRMVTGAVVFVGGVSHLLIALQAFGDVIDVFGCSLPIVRWVEWQILAPYMILLFYTLDVPIEGENLLPRQASVSVTFQTFRIIFFVLGAISKSPVLTLIGYAIAVGFFMESFVSFWCFYERLRLISDPNQRYLSLFTAPKSLLCQARSHLGGDDLISKEKEMQIVFRGFQLSTICTFTCLGFCAIYFSGAFGVDRNIQAVLTSLVDCGTKLLYSAGVREGHLEYFNPEEILKYIIESERERQQQASVKRKTFLRYIFHEIRVPLNTIVLGITDVAHTEKFSQAGAQTIDSMRISAGMMSNTLNDVLSFSAVEDGRLTLAMSVFKLRDAITSTVQAFLTAARDGNVTVQQCCASTLPTLVIGDANRVSQVLANLLSNSIKFTKEKSNNKISVRVSQAEVTKAPDFIYITIAVEDNGRGISREDLQRLFIPYAQVRPGELQEGRGSGLGLVIAQQLCELHGGGIQVESILGQGSTFSATFKFGVVSAAPTVAAAPPLDYSKLSSLSVLVVDDVKTNRSLVKRLLQRMGLRGIDMAENGREAVEKATSQHYDIILMDMMMPVMDGVQATAVLTETRVNTKIVGLTGNALEEDVVLGERALWMF